MSIRIGLISDIHANLPALQAVLDDMPAVDRLICAGDIVGYNPYPSACVDLVRERCDTVIKGNHDRTVQTPFQYAHSEMARAGLEYANKALSQEQHEWLESLPPRAECADGQFKLAHSHPDPDRLGEYVMPEDFTAVADHLSECRGVVLGHTHVQHAETVDGNTIVNPGSVGQPRDGDPAAAYAVIELRTDMADVSLYRTSYDINQIVEKLNETNLPERTAQRLYAGQ
jgi:phosphoesterase, MJ0936 family